MGGVTHKASPASRLFRGTPSLAGSSAPVLSPEQTEQHRVAQQRTEALLRDLWRRKLPMVRDQIQLLRRATATLESATLTAPLRAEAAIAAHKLAGSLGMFGYHEGTRCAREIEALLDADQAPPAISFGRLLEQLEASLSSK